MTLDEAIKHCEEVAEEQDKLFKQYDDASKYSRSYNKDIVSANAKKCLECFECAKQHRQLAEWLKDYKRLLEQEPCEDAVSRKAVLNLARDLDFSKVKGLEHYKHRCIEIEDVEELPSVTPQPEKICIASIHFDEDKLKEICKNAVLTIVSDNNILLDNIRAEIENIAYDWQEIDGEHESRMVVDLIDVLKIIDKYKAERSEE